MCIMYLDGTREFVTVIEGVCADGTALKPTIILKAEEFIAEWFQKVRGVPENILFGRSHNGWTDEKMAMEFLKRNFGSESTTAHKAGDEFRLLLFDGHSSHVNMQFLDFCITQKIIPYCLPPHTTHRLQPLDISIFSPYKHQYQKELTRSFEKHEYGVSKENFSEILMIARRASFTPSNIQSGLRNTGLVSVNRNIVISKIQALPPRSPICNTTETNTSHTAFNSDSMHPELLNTFSVQQIDSLDVPQSRLEIQQQELVALASLRRNDSTEWGLKKIISNLAVSANRGLTEVEEKQRQIRNLKQQLAEIQKKWTGKRTRIPTSARAWIDQEDIESFFEARSAEKHDGLRKKYDRATNLVTLGTNKFAECIQKRKETEKLEEDGKLPKGRKTSTTLLEEESRLRHQIVEANQKVEKLERHLQDLAFDGDGSENLVGSPDEEAGNEFDEELEDNLRQGAGAEQAPAPR